MSRTTALDRARENMEEATEPQSAAGGPGGGGVPAPVVEALPKEARDLVEHPNQPTKNPTLRCPCGSTKPADMMVDVEAEGLGEVFEEPFVCSTCVRHAGRQGRI